MKRMLIVSILIGLFSLGLSSCNLNNQLNSHPTPSIIPSDKISSGLITPPVDMLINGVSLPFYEDLQLQDGEAVEILDVQNNKLLLHVYTNYNLNDPLFREEGYNSVTQTIKVYDLIRQEIISSWKLPVIGLCTSAAFVGNSFAYTVLILKL